MPFTVAWRGSGTIDSPCEPSVIASTAEGAADSSSAMKYLSRALSSTPAMPITRSLGNPDSWDARNVISSRGLVTTIRIASAECSTTCPTTWRRMPAFFSSRSIRLIPGCRGSPAVMTTTSEPAVSA